MVKLNVSTKAASISPYLGSGWLAQSKLDGVRLAVVWAADGPYGLTRGGHRAPAPAGLPDMPVGTLVDGELVGTGTWESALSSLRTGGGSWVPFDLSSDQSFPARLHTLVEAGFDPLPAAPVHLAWERAAADGAEGIVIRSVAGGYSSAAFKVKFPHVYTCLAHKGFLFVVDENRRPKAVARYAGPLTGRVRVECEGITANGNLRAARVIGPAPVAADVGAHQLRRAHGDRVAERGS